MKRAKLTIIGAGNVGSSCAVAAAAKELGDTKTQHSIISIDLTVTGDIVTAGDLTVEGAVDGSITCRTLTLGGTPDIKGDVTAETVRVCGAFSGTIAASQVHLVKSAVMKGDIRYRTLTIDVGGSNTKKSQQYHRIITGNHMLYFAP